jgi:chemotaxis protein CheZ
VSAGGAGDRQQITRRVRAALWAIEHGDEAGWRAQVDALIEWRNQPLLQGLVRLARELGQTLGDGEPASGASLPDACAHLERVVRITEDASHRALDQIDQCRALLSLLPTGDAVQAGTLASIRAHLSEMTAAQGYQDLTGQVILRVVEIVRCVQAGMGSAEPQPVRPLHLPGSLAAIDPTPTSQDEANQLLSSLGL